MSKLKNHSGAKKRFKATGSGLKMRSANRSHILSKHTTKKKRQACLFFLVVCLDNMWLLFADLIFKPEPVALNLFFAPEWFFNLLILLS